MQAVEQLRVMKEDAALELDNALKSLEMERKKYLNDAEQAIETVKKTTHEQLCKCRDMDLGRLKLMYDMHIQVRLA